jgi:hypothetical protein
MFGSVLGIRVEDRRRPEDLAEELDRVRRELLEANAEIERLRAALGSNHPLGLRTIGFF